MSSFLVEVLDWLEKSFRALQQKKKKKTALTADRTQGGDTVAVTAWLLHTHSRRPFEVLVEWRRCTAIHCQATRGFDSLEGLGVGHPYLDHFPEKTTLIKTYSVLSFLSIRTHRRYYSTHMLSKTDFSFFYYYFLNTAGNQLVDFLHWKIGLICISSCRW